MTMVPAQTLSKHHQLYYYCGGYGCSNTEEEEEEAEAEEYYNYETTADAGGLLGGGSDHPAAGNNNPMAEEESRTPTTTTNYATSAASLNNNNNNNIKEGAASSSKDVQVAQDDENWLQLSIGGATSAKTNINADETTRTRGGGGGGGGLVELDLLPGRSIEGERVISQEVTRRVLPVSTPIFHVSPRQQLMPSFLFQAAGAGSSSSTVVPLPHPPPHHRHQEINWAFRPAAVLSSSSPATSSNNPSSFVLGSYFTRTPFQLHGGPSGGVDVSGTSLDFRVIDPPRRPHSGIWFSLQASQNQAKEPFLPQIPKSYLRIRDGRMTVRLLMKYLVNKLRLDSESEVEITCRGQQLLPFLTLQHVRDNIWSPRDAITLLPDSSSTDHHLMVLQYGRTA